MPATIAEYQNQFLNKHRLPASYLDTAAYWFEPIGDQIAQQLEQLRQQTKNRALVLGISGCQGSGKSTLTDYLCQYLQHKFQLQCFYSSIDDFYLSKAARQALATTVHPLLATRGVPGTHRIDVLIRCVEQAKHQRAFNTPLFDKLCDDVKTDVVSVPKGIDIYIIEGWCIGANPQPDEALTIPINELESAEDPNGAWRHFVNLQLKQSYASLWQQLDSLILLKAPSFDVVKSWRFEQEEKLALQRQRETTNSDYHIMTKAETSRFIQHYQRITEHIFSHLTATANHVLFMNETRQITDYTVNDLN